MASAPCWFRLVCPACSAATLCGPEQMLARLRQLGMLRREKEPSWELIGELFQSTASRMSCEQCGQRGLAVDAVEDDWDEQGWNAPPRCTGCGGPIPPDRLAAFPGAQRCVTCQQASERGEVAAPPEFCPRCGTPMTLGRRGGSGLAGYQMVCPECRR